MPSPARVTSAVGVQVAVGTAPGLGPYGTVDMAGNVKEWAWNEQAGTGNRYILGGGWNDPDYQFLYSDSRSPLDRSDTNGFRCIAYGDGPAPPASLAAPVAAPAQDQGSERPVADAVYSIYADEYRLQSHAIRRTGRVDRRCLTAVAA